MRIVGIDPREIVYVYTPLDFVVILWRHGGTESAEFSVNAPSVREVIAWAESQVADSVEVYARISRDTAVRVHGFDPTQGDSVASLW